MSAPAATSAATLHEAPSDHRIRDVASSAVNPPSSTLPIW